MTKKQIFEYLDGFTFVNEAEVEMAVADLFMEKFGAEPCYEDLVQYAIIADEYMNKRGLLALFNQ